MNKRTDRRFTKDPVTAQSEERRMRERDQQKWKPVLPDKRLVCSEIALPFY
jgi:predicted protein tyrosine phosphatase